MMSAAEKDQLDVCVKLVELGADIDRTDQVSENCCNCISILTTISISCASSCLNQVGMSALMFAAQKDQWKLCVKLAELGADLNLAKKRVIQTCSNRYFSCCVIVLLTDLFFELGW